jgi:hypothetical protein
MEEMRQSPMYFAIFSAVADAVNVRWLTGANPAQVQMELRKPMLSSGSAHPQLPTEDVFIVAELFSQA